MKPVVIFGTADFARIAKVYLERDGGREVAAFAVDGQYRTVDELLGTPVIDAEAMTTTHPPSKFDAFAAIGFSGVNKSRAAVYERLKAQGYTLVTYVSTHAHLVADIEIGDNSFVFEANVIQPFVRIGNDCVIWSGNHIGHDSVIGDHVFIASHAVISGNVTIGDYTFVGVNATFRDGITVAPECVIGAGAVILKDTEHAAVHASRHTDAHPRRSWELKGF